MPSTHYRTDLRDIEFDLFEVFGLPDDADFDRDTVRDLLRAVDRLAHDGLAPHWDDHDRPLPRLDAEAQEVRVPGHIRTAYRSFDDSGFWRLDLPAELGGTPAPRGVWWAVVELLMGANPAAMMYGCTDALLRVLHQSGTPEQRRWAGWAAERRWATTMAFTEPDAGSDLGMATTSARPQPDGSWHLTGAKRFISGGDHDLAENILHFVAARPDGAGPGTRGLSLFVVPKHRFDPNDGTLLGRNGVRPVRLEHKMGLHGSATCELVFGAAEPARGWLIGDVHDGIRQVFSIITHFRMLVGAKATATLSTGYLNALAYARHRIQGAGLRDAADARAPRIAIIGHPDVRRSLMLQKCYAEGLRALYLYCASWQDRALGASDAVVRRAAHGVVDLLLPVVKGLAAERAADLLSGEALQIGGGAGYLRDLPFEQYVRDTRIDALYEGTTAIQSLDLLIRKITANGGVALARVLADVRMFVDKQMPDAFPADQAGALADALGAVDDMAATTSGWFADDGDPHGRERAALHSRRLLMALGDLLVGWLLHRQAVVARAVLERDGTSAGSVTFSQGKDAAAAFFAGEVLPRLGSDLRTVATAGTELMTLDDAAFGP